MEKSRLRFAKIAKFTAKSWHQQSSHNIDVKPLCSTFNIAFLYCL